MRLPWHGLPGEEGGVSASPALPGLSKSSAPPAELPACRGAAPRRAEGEERDGPQEGRTRAEMRHEKWKK